MRRLLSVVLVTGVVCGACTREPPAPAPAAPDPVVTAALDQLSRRLAPVRDYAVEGTVEDVDTQQKMRFRYATQQPSFSAGELYGLDGARLRAFVFDGKVLAIVDDGTKTTVKQDLSGDEERMLLSLHQIFSEFVCEGWRPPLVKPQGTQGAVEGDRWVLTVPIVDEVLSAQRITLRTDGSFVKKELLDDRGVAVASTTVLEDWTDPATGLAFPKRWEHAERGSVQRVSLDKMAVNAGVDPARFSTATPAGYTERAP